MTFLQPSKLRWTAQIRSRAAALPAARLNAHFGRPLQPAAPLPVRSGRRGAAHVKVRSLVKEPPPEAAEIEGPSTDLAVISNRLGKVCVCCFFACCESERSVYKRPLTLAYTNGYPTHNSW